MLLLERLEDRNAPSYITPYTVYDPFYNGYATVQSFPADATLEQILALSPFQQALKRRNDQIDKLGL